MLFRSSSLANARERENLKRFLKATIEGNRLALADAHRAKQVLALELRGTTPRIIDIAYDDFEKQSPPDIAPSIRGVENILAMFPGASTRIADYIDTSLLDEIR